MPRRSYLRQIAGGCHGVAVLSPPRVLFRPAALPMAVMASLETRLPAASTPQRQPLARSGEPGPAPSTRTPRRASDPRSVMAGPAPPEPAAIVPGERGRPRPPGAAPVRVKEETTGVEMRARAAPTAEGRAAARSVEPGPAPLTAPPRPTPGPAPILAGPAPPQLSSIVPADPNRPLRPAPAPVSISGRAAQLTEPGGPVGGVKASPSQASVAPEPQHRQPPADPVEPLARPKEEDAGVRARPAAFVPVADRVVGAVDSSMTSAVEVPPVAVPRASPSPASPAMTTGPVPTVLRSVGSAVTVPRVEPQPASPAMTAGPVPTVPHSVGSPVTVPRVDPQPASPAITTGTAPTLVRSVEPPVAVPRVDPQPASPVITTGPVPTVLRSVGPPVAVPRVDPPPASPAMTTVPVPTVLRSVGPPVSVPRVGPPPAFPAMTTGPVPTRPTRLDRLSRSHESARRQHRPARLGRLSWFHELTRSQHRPSRLARLSRFRGSARRWHLPP